MGRQRNEKSIEAERLYKEDFKKLVEIAEILDVPVGTVRRWKHDYNWDLDSERSEKMSKKQKPNVRKKAEIKKSVRSVTENRELHEKEQLFCLLFAQNPVATTAYQKAWGCGYKTAKASGWKLLQKPTIRAEVQRLKKIKFESMMLEADDVVEKYMRVAFSDMDSYLEWGTEEVPVMTQYGQLTEEDPATGESIPVTKTANYVRFRPSSEVDGSLVAEVKNGKDGASIKLLDAAKAMEWLSRYFVIHPESQYKLEYEKKRAEKEFAEEKNDLAEDWINGLIGGETDG